MAYQPNIPGPNTNLSVSQGDLLGNFQALNTTFGVDHNKFDAVTNAGAHLQVTLPNFGTPGAPGGTASVIYTKNVASSPTLYFKNGTADSVVWTGGSGTGLSTLTTSASTPGSGSLILPNGLKMIWGTQSVSGSSTTVVFGSTGFPNQCQSCQVSGIPTNSGGAATAFTVYQLSKTGFRFIYTGSSLSALMYLAIGF